MSSSVHHYWTEWDFIDWANDQIYSAHYDAWFKYICNLEDMRKGTNREQEKSL